MGINLINFGDSSSGLSALGVDGKAFIIQLITFLLAFLVLKRYAFKPIIKILNERRETIEQGVKLGDKLKQEKADLEAEVDKTLHAARIKADDILASANNSAKEAIHEAEEQAKIKAEQIIKDAEARINLETARARKELEKELVGLVADTTEVLIKEKIDSAKDTRLIEAALKEQRA